MKPADGTSNLELEAKYVITKGEIDGINRSLLKLKNSGKLMIAGTRVLDFTDYYYDTPDLLLAFNNCSLRLRERPGYPTKLTFKKFISSSGEGIQLRLELEGIPTKRLINNVLEEAPWLAIRQQTNPNEQMVGHIELMHSIGVFNTFRIVNQRTIHTIVTHDELYAEISIDNGKFRKDSLDIPLYEFEIEYLSGDQSRMPEFCRMVTSKMGGLKDQKQSKYIRGLKELNMWKDRKRVKSDRLKQWKKELKDLFRNFLDHYNEAVNFTDAGALHKTRVTIRRITTLLNFLPDIGDDSSSGTFILTRLTEVQNRLGMIRDLDVLLANTIHSKAHTPSGVITLIELKRQETILQTLGAFNSLNLKKLNKQWKKFSDKELKGALGSATVEQHYLNLKNRLRRAVDDFIESRKIRGGSHPISIKKLHRCRIILKQLRYASESIEMLSPGSPEIDTQQYVDLQDRLGHLNDQFNEITFYETITEDLGDILNSRIHDRLESLRLDFAKNLEDLDMLASIPWKAIANANRDLTEVKGVGLKTMQILNDAGIKDIDDLAQMEEEQLLQQTALSEQLINRAIKEDWIGQARKLAL